MVIYKGFEVGDDEETEGKRDGVDSLSKGKCPYVGLCDYEKSSECYNPSVAGFCPPEALPLKRSWTQL